MNLKHLAQGATLAVLLTGCATTAVPHELIASSQGAIRAAEEIGAEKVPSAALHLQLAKEQADRANTLIREGDNMRASYVLQRAAADADLALALAREAPLRAEAQKAVDDLQSVKQKIAQ